MVGTQPRTPYMFPSFRRIVFLLFCPLLLRSINPKGKRQDQHPLPKWMSCVCHLEVRTEGLILCCIQMGPAWVTHSFIHSLGMWQAPAVCQALS